MKSSFILAIVLVGLRTCLAGDIHDCSNCGQSGYSFWYFDSVRYEYDSERGRLGDSLLSVFMQEKPRHAIESLYVAWLAGASEPAPERHLSVKPYADTCIGLKRVYSFGDDSDVLLLQIEPVEEPRHAGFLFLAYNNRDSSFYPLVDGFGHTFIENYNEFVRECGSGLDSNLTCRTATVLSLKYNLGWNLY
jgi:hypothetical protein